MNEKEVIKQLIEIIDKVNLDKLGIKQKLEGELDRYSHFRYSVLGLEKQELEEKKKIDMKKYAKFIFTNGTAEEKRELLRCFKSKITLMEGQVKV